MIRTKNTIYLLTILNIKQENKKKYKIETSKTKKMFLPINKIKLWTQKYNLAISLEIPLFNLSSSRKYQDKIRVWSNKKNNPPLDTNIQNKSKEKT